MTEYEDDVHKALALVYKDIKDNPGRERQSVVLATIGSPDPLTYEEAKEDRYQEWYAKGIKRLHEMGVPFVCAAGNHGNNAQRQNIDTAPAILEDNGNPIIVVGAADYKGERVKISQVGSQLTIYAPGQDVLVQTRRDFNVNADVPVTGTSFGKQTHILPATKPYCLKNANKLSSGTTGCRSYCNVPIIRPKTLG